MTGKKIKWTKQIDSSDHQAVTATNLCLLLGVPVDFVEMRKTINAHPDYPTLLALSESLREWGVITEGVQGTITDLSTADFPGIAHLKNLEFVVLKEFKDGKITYIDNLKGIVTCTLDEFSEIWSGVILRTVPEKRETSEKKQCKSNERNRIGIRTILRGSILLLIVLSALKYSMETFPNAGIITALGLVKLAGLIFSAMLTWHEISHSAVIKSLCVVGKKIDCNRVLNSPGANLFGFPTADLGILYFSGGLLTLLFMMIADQSSMLLFLLAVLNLLALPYTLFSVIYQAFIVRAWCWMCVSVQALFWIEFYLLFDWLKKGYSDLSLKVLLLFAIGMTIPVMVWIRLRPLIEKSASATKLEAELRRVRCNPDYIRFLLSEAQKVDLGHFQDEVQIGNIDAPFVFTIVVNPFCVACKNTFRQLEKLIVLTGGAVKGNIRFLVSGNKDHALATDLINLYRSGNQRVVYDFLAGKKTGYPGFDNRQLKKGMKKNSEENVDVSDSVDAEIAKLLRSYKEWADLLSINTTPAIILNDILLPTDSRIEDFKYFIFRHHPF